MIFSFPSPVLKGQLGVGLLLGLRLPIAQAHTGLHDQAGILSGLLHPLLGIDHLFAMLAVGILASRVMSTMVWRLPAIFLTLMVLGACSGMALGPLPWVESMIALSLLFFWGPHGESVPIDLTTLINELCGTFWRLPWLCPRS